MPLQYRIRTADNIDLIRESMFANGWFVQVIVRPLTLPQGLSRKVKLVGCPFIRKEQLDCKASECEPDPGECVARYVSNGTARRCVILFRLYRYPCISRALAPR